MRIIEKAAEFIKKNQIKLIGYSPKQITIQVKDKLVVFQKKLGRALDTCSCQNHARFCKENPRCSHKLAAATYIVMKGVKW